MAETATIIQFNPKQQIKKTDRKRQQIKNTDGIRYFSKTQILLIRRTAKDRATVAKGKGNVTAIREWMIIDLLTSSGLRVAECADLRCGDVKTGYGQQAIFVRNGKGNRSRTVQIPDSLKRHLNSFLSWKRDRGEATGKNDHIFVGQRGALSSQGVSQAVKKLLKMLNLYEPGKAAHSLRHSYACTLYRTERDLRAVQKQLGHSSIEITKVYADVMDEDLQRQVKNLW